MFGLASMLISSTYNLPPNFTDGPYAYIVLTSKKSPVYIDCPLGTPGSGHVHSVDSFYVVIRKIVNE